LDRAVNTKWYDCIPFTASTGSTSRTASPAGIISHRSANVSFSPGSKGCPLLSAPRGGAIPNMTRMAADAHSADVVIALNGLRPLDLCTPKDFSLTSFYVFNCYNGQRMSFLIEIGAGNNSIIPGLQVYQPQASCLCRLLEFLVHPLDFSPSHIWLVVSESSPEGMGYVHQLMDEHPGLLVISESVEFL